MASAADARDGVVVGSVDDGHRRALAGNALDARGRGSGRHEDMRRVTEHPRHVRDRATVVAIGRGNECERTQR